MYIARPELGTKRTCVGCTRHFYDLSRTPARCPTCLVEQPPPRARSAPIARGFGTRWSPRTAPAATPAAAEAADDDAVPLLDAAEEDDDEDADDTAEAEIAAASDEET